MLNDTPDASPQNKFPNIIDAAAPEAALGSKGYAQPIVGCQVAAIRKFFCTLTSTVIGSHKSARLWWTWCWVWHQCLCLMLSCVLVLTDVLYSLECSKVKMTMTDTRDASSCLMEPGWNLVYVHIITELSFLSLTQCNPNKNFKPWHSRGFVQLLVINIVNL